MAPKGIPGEFAQGAVILVKVVAGVGEDEVGFERAFDLLETIFHLGAVIGKKTIAETFDDDSTIRGALQKPSRTFLRFPLTVRVRTEDNPADFAGLRLAEQMEQRSTAADLDIVAVSTEAEDPFCVL